MTGTVLCYKGSARTESIFITNSEYILALYSLPLEQPASWPAALRIAPQTGGAWRPGTPHVVRCRGRNHYRTSSKAWQNRAADSTFPNPLHRIVALLDSPMVLLQSTVLSLSLVAIDAKENT